jgi:DNA-binding transcriptional LysR family regulator
MELRHLRYFLVVAEELNFTRAAARLNMQQPPLSHQIRLLENELGFDLFRRHPKGADLTAGGHAFVAEATAILARLKQATQRARRVADGMEGTLSVGFTLSAEAHALTPALIRAYRQAYPGVTFDLAQGNAAELTERVAVDKADIALLRTPVHLPPGLETVHLLDEELLLVLPSAHPALANGTAVPLTALAHEQFILLRRPGAPDMYADLLAACAALGFAPMLGREVDHMLTSISLVAAGAGVTIVPASLRGFHADRVTYCRIADVPAPLTLPIHAVCRPDRLTPMGQNFLAMAQELAGA